MRFFAKVVSNILFSLNPFTIYRINFMKRVKGRQKKIKDQNVRKTRVKEL